MIASLNGQVAAIAPDSLVLEVGGVGYRVFATPALIASTEVGRPLRLHTHHQIREDAQALYGFAATEDLALFELLLTVTGVGPKVALSIVGSRPVGELQLAILQADEAVLTGVSGVGKRLAARIILELREKIGAAGAAAAAAAAAAGDPAGSAGAAGFASEGELIGALQALGYSLPEAREAARAAARAGGVAGAGATLEDRVKSALRQLSTR